MSSVDLRCSHHLPYSKHDLVCVCVCVCVCLCVCVCMCVYVGNSEWKGKVGIAFKKFEYKEKFGEGEEMKR